MRTYTKEDYPSLKQTLIEGNLYDKTWDAEIALNKRIMEKPDSIIVAVVDNQVIGCVYLVDDFIPFIFRLVVKKDFRKQGIGKMLIAEAISILKKHGHKEISLFVDNKNEELIEWYRKQGFKGENSWTGLWKEI